MINIAAVNYVANLLAEVKQLQGELERLSDHYQGLMRENDEKDAQAKRLRALVYAQNEVIKAARSLRQRGGENPSRGTWPALHQVFDALDVLDSRRPN